MTYAYLLLVFFFSGIISGVFIKPFLTLMCWMCERHLTCFMVTGFSDWGGGSTGKDLSLRNYSQGASYTLGPDLDDEILILKPETGAKMG